MGFFDKVQDFMDKRAEKKEVERLKVRQMMRENVSEDFIKKSYRPRMTSKGFDVLFDMFTESELDKIIKANAPYLTFMIEELYLNQEKVTQLHELEGRYAELKEQYESLKQEYATLLKKLPS